MKEQMKRFSYFQEWNEELINECVHLSKLKYFYSFQTVYGDGIGHSSYVYFLLEGKCCVIEDLQILVKYDSFGNKKYYLYKEDDDKQKNITTSM